MSSLIYLANICFYPEIGFRLFVEVHIYHCWEGGFKYWSNYPETWVCHSRWEKNLPAKSPAGAIFLFIWWQGIICSILDVTIGLVGYLFCEICSYVSFIVCLATAASNTSFRGDKTRCWFIEVLAIQQRFPCNSDPWWQNTRGIYICLNSTVVA